MNKQVGGVAVFLTDTVQGDVTIKDCKKGVNLIATFTKLPPGKHGFHIHKAGDLRGEGCMGLCEHYDVGKNVHGDQPTKRNKERHTGDLGNVQIKKGKKTFKKKYCIPQTSVKALWGRSIIVHADEDDLGKGTFEDSKTTGHSGKRIACAIIGRSMCSKTQKKSKK
jgi:Cu-Zn family superoxide dismutase